MKFKSNWDGKAKLWVLTFTEGALAGEEVVSRNYGRALLLAHRLHAGACHVKSNR